jgi:hypothetical protein
MNDTTQGDKTMTYILTTTHELTPEEIARAPKGLKRSLIEQHFKIKSEALEQFDFESYLLDRLGFDDTVTLTNSKGVVMSSRGHQETKTDNATLKSGKVFS